MKRQTIRFISLWAIVLSTSLNVQAQFAGGTGEPNDPYLIATAEELRAVGEDPTLLDKHFALVSDVDLDPNLPGGQVFDRAVIAQNSNGVHSFSGLPFTGSLDGRGSRIENMVLRGGHHFLGLFGEIGEGGLVRDLRLENVRIERQNRGHVGAMAGSNRGTIERCRSDGFVSGGSYVGGLVGRNYGIIDSCCSDCTVSGSGNIGGLVGCLFSGAITDCYATGSASIPAAGDRVGGLVGRLYGGFLSRCYARGRVSGGDDYAGGLSGYMFMTTALAGGSTVCHCFWDRDTSGRIWSEGGFGRTTAQMKSEATFIGWGPQWVIVEGLDYPHLAWEGGDGIPLDNHPPRVYEGGGDPNEPFVLQDAADLLCLMSRPEDWGSAFEMANDIDMNEVPFLPLAKFSGSLDGKGHTIKNLTIHEDSIQLGLIGSLSGGIVRNLSMADVDIQGGSSQAGALAAINASGRITNCGATGTMVRVDRKQDGVIYGSDGIGGLVGVNYEGYISKCWATPETTVHCASAIIGGLVGVNLGQVTCSWARGNALIGQVTFMTGGFVGSNSESITNCFAGGSIARQPGPAEEGSCGYSRSLGGFAASNSGGIVNCYARTHLSAADPNCARLFGFLSAYSEGTIGCFWDTEVCAGNLDSAGTGLTTTQMQQRQTYVDAGWDLIGESANGTSDLWFVPEGGGFPELVGFSDGYNVPPLPGSGTRQDPYLVATAEDLGTIRHRDSVASYKLVADIDLTGIAWSEPPVPNFHGRFDGAGHIITNLVIYGGNTLGLFGRLGSRSAVLDLGLPSAHIEGGGDRTTYLGCLAGASSGSVRNCWSTVDVLGPDNSEYLGGLVGQTTGDITGCYTAGRIMGLDHNWRVGGLAGATSGNVAYCGSIVAITGGQDCWLVGGLIGDADGPITGCHAEGSLSLGEEAYLIGGLVGQIQTPNPVTDCGSAVTVVCGKGGESIGGLIGSNYKTAVSGSRASGAVSGGTSSRTIGGLIGESEQGVVNDCYATGPVSGDHSIGGLIGIYSGDLVERCYAAGKVSGSKSVGGFVGTGWGEIHRCFWDVLSSGTDDGGQNTVVGKTTAQMQEASTFTEWDFQNVWTICEGEDYPRLKWEEADCAGN